MPKAATTTRPRNVVSERVDRYPEPDGVRLHLPDGPAIDEWQPVMCGGGVIYSGPRTKAPESDVCVDCLSGTQTL